MKPRMQVSIARVMLLILFVTVDLALLQMTYRRNVLPPYDPGALLLIPALQVAWFGAFPRRSRRPSWAGFLAAGAVVLLLYSGVRGPFQDLANRWSTAVYYFLRARGFDVHRLSDDLDTMRVISSVYGLIVIGLPLLLICAAGGVAITRAAVASRRGPAPAGA